MTNLQIINELCGICADLIRIVAVQRNALAQLNTLTAEEEIANVRDRYTALLGADEWSAAIPQGDEKQ